MSFAANESAFGSPSRYCSRVAKQRDEVDDEHEMLRIMNLELLRRREAQIEWLMAPFSQVDEALSKSLLLPEHPSDDEMEIRGVSPSSVTLIDRPTHNAPETSRNEGFSCIRDTHASFSCHVTPKKPFPLPRDSGKGPFFPSEWLEDLIQPSSTRLNSELFSTKLDDGSSRSDYCGK